MSEQDTEITTRSRRHSRTPYGLAMIFVALLFVSAWFMRGQFQPVIAGQPAPSFAAETLNAEPVALEDYDGKVLLVNIWATWCVPCLTEMPSMERLYREIGSEDFEILAVSVDVALGETDGRGNAGASKEKIGEFVDELGLTFEVLHQPSGIIQRDYQTTGVPESFIIDRDGVIFRRLAGSTVWDHPRYRELILDLLEG